MFLFVNNCFVPFADVVFISSNTDALLTHEACVTISSAVAWLEEGQRLGVEAEQALILPGLTFCITKTLIFLTCVLTIILQELQLLICTHLNIGILLPCLKYLNTDYNGDGRKLAFVICYQHPPPNSTLLETLDSYSSHLKKTLLLYCCRLWMVQGERMWGCHNISCMKLRITSPCSPTDNHDQAHNHHHKSHISKTYNHNQAQHQNSGRLDLFFFHQAHLGSIPKDTEQGQMWIWHWYYYLDIIIWIISRISCCLKSILR